jgi:hypothetical protein
VLRRENPFHTARVIDAVIITIKPLGFFLIDTLAAIAIASVVSVQQASVHWDSDLAPAFRTYEAHHFGAQDQQFRIQAAGLSLAAGDGRDDLVLRETMEKTLVKVVEACLAPVQVQAPHGPVSIPPLRSGAAHARVEDFVFAERDQKSEGGRYRGRIVTSTGCASWKA